MLRTVVAKLAASFLRCSLVWLVLSQLLMVLALWDMVSDDAWEAPKLFGSYALHQVFMTAYVGCFVGLLVLAAGGLILLVAVLIGRRPALEVVEVGGGIACIILIVASVFLTAGNDQPYAPPGARQFAGVVIAAIADVGLFVILAHVTRKYAGGLDCGSTNA